MRHFRITSLEPTKIAADFLEQRFNEGEEARKILCGLHFHLTPPDAVINLNKKGPLNHADANFVESVFEALVEFGFLIKNKAKRYSYNPRIGSFLIEKERLEAIRSTPMVSVFPNTDLVKNFFANNARKQYEFYLIANIRWSDPYSFSFVEPCAPFKIGFSQDPEVRLKQLKTNSAHNLMLVATAPGSYSRLEATAIETTMLAQAETIFSKTRGEWFNGDPMIAWEKVFKPRGGFLLNSQMSVDLHQAKLIPLTSALNDKKPSKPI